MKADENLKPIIGNELRIAQSHRPLSDFAVHILVEKFSVFGVERRDRGQRTQRAGVAVQGQQKSSQSIRALRLPGLKIDCLLNVPCPGVRRLATGEQTPRIKNCVFGATDFLLTPAIQSPAAPPQTTAHCAGSARSFRSVLASKTKPPSGNDRWRLCRGALPD